MIKKVFIIIVLLLILAIGGYFVYTSGQLPLMTSGVEFDPKEHLRIRVIDSVTNEGVEGVPITFFNSCMGIATSDKTCGGKYDITKGGKTNEDGYYIVIKTEITAPPGVLHFQLGNISGYNTDVGTGSFMWEDGPRVDVVYKVTKTTSDSGKNNQDTAVSVVENSKEFKEWSSFMEEVYGPTVDVREGLWRIYYQGVRENAGDWMITFYVDNNGEIKEVEEPMRKVLQQ